MKSKSRAGCILIFMVAACTISAGVIALITLFGSTSQFLISQRSMVPAYAVGDHVLVDRLFFHITVLRRGDVLIVNISENGDTTQLKRIIAMPGDKVQIHDGQVWVNDKLLAEPYLSPGMKTSFMGVNSWQLGPQDYFVMGDNRPESGDSRIYGPVPEAHIIGRVIVRY